MYIICTNRHCWWDQHLMQSMSAKRCFKNTVSRSMAFITVSLNWLYPHYSPAVSFSCGLIRLLKLEETGNNTLVFKTLVNNKMYADFFQKKRLRKSLKTLHKKDLLPQKYLFFFSEIKPNRSAFILHLLLFNWYVSLTYYSSPPTTPNISCVGTSWLSCLESLCRLSSWCPAVQSQSRSLNELPLECLPLSSPLSWSRTGTEGTDAAIGDVSLLSDRKIPLPELYSLLESAPRAVRKTNTEGGCTDGAKTFINKHSHEKQDCPKYSTLGFKGKTKKKKNTQHDAI